MSDHHRVKVFTCNCQRAHRPKRSPHARQANALSRRSRSWATQILDGHHFGLRWCGHSTRSATVGADMTIQTLGMSHIERLSRGDQTGPSVLRVDCRVAVLLRAEFCRQPIWPLTRTLNRRGRRSTQTIVRDRRSIGSSQVKSRQAATRSWRAHPPLDSARCRVEGFDVVAAMGGPDSSIVEFRCP